MLLTNAANTATTMVDVGLSTVFVHVIFEKSLLEIFKQSVGCSSKTPEISRQILWPLSIGC